MSKDLVPLNTRPNWKEVMRPENALRRQPHMYPSRRPSTHVTQPQQSKVTAGAVNQILNDAANFFENGGNWCQSGIGSNRGDVCAVGAMLMMESGELDNVYNETQPFRHPMTSAAVAKLANYLSDIKAIPHFRQNQFDDISFGAVAAWNDDSLRTKAEVVAVLRGAAGQG